MSIIDRLHWWREWVPIPHEGGRIEPVRWILLEANRLGVTGALLTFVFVSFMLIGTVWTFEMQQILTETVAIQTILNTLLGGIILLVSIVVSINSIVLSHDLQSVEAQEDRIDGAMQFRHDAGELTERGRSPSDPASFLKLMGGLIADRAEALEKAADVTEEEFSDEIQEYADEIRNVASRFHEPHKDQASGAEFGVLWVGLEVDYGRYVDHVYTLKLASEETMSEDLEERLNDVLEAFRLFAIGREYFKTLYYSLEISQLSISLLVISLPAILVNASAILAINAQLYPDFWLFGLPPVLTFVAAIFTISLAPYVVLTAYVLRLATVAKRTATGGAFTLGV